MSDTYMRNAAAQIQERRTSIPPPQPGRAHDGSQVNTLYRPVQNVSFNFFTPPFSFSFFLSLDMKCLMTRFM